MIVTTHAVERYIERIAPQMTADEARGQTGRMRPDAWSMRDVNHCLFYKGGGD